MQKVSYMKFQMIRVTLAVVYLLFFSCELFAQNEKIIFNLTDGTFEDPIIPYVHPVVVSGVPTKDKGRVSAIKLVVKQIVDDEEDKLLVSTYRMSQLNELLKAENDTITFLNGVKDELKADLSTAKIADLTTKLKSNAPGNLYKVISEILSKTNAKPEEIVAVKKSIESELGVRQRANQERVKQINDLQDLISDLEASIGDNVFFQGIWIGSSDTDDEFIFSMPDKFKMAEKYSFEFNIYKKNPTTVPIDDLLKPLIKEFDQVLDSLNYYSRDSLLRKVSETLNAIERKYFTNLFHLDETANSIVPQTGFEFSDANINQITTRIQKFYTNWRQVNAETEQVTRLKAAVENAIGGNSSRNRQVLDLIDKPGQSDNIRVALKQLKVSNDSVEIVINNYQTVRAILARIEKGKQTIENDRIEIQKSFDRIKDLYASGGTITSTATTGSTDIKGIKLSTTYGIGLVPLDKNTIEWFRFIGINFRFDGFDNRLPGEEAYHSAWSRVSFMVGISTTADMKYKGDKLENIRLGFKPVFGFNYEPLKHLNVGLGIISFIQESQFESQKSPKIRGYLSLSFDFNLFNQLIQNQTK